MHGASTGLVGLLLTSLERNIYIKGNRRVVSGEHIYRGNRSVNHKSFSSKLRVKRVTKKKGGGEHFVVSGYFSAGPLGPQALAIGRPKQGLHRRDEGSGWERWVDREEWRLAVQGGVSGRQGGRAREARSSSMVVVILWSGSGSHSGKFLVLDGKCGTRVELVQERCGF